MEPCRKWRTMLAVGILLSVLAGCSGSGDAQTDDPTKGGSMEQTEVSVVLTDRQKEILEAGGLPTEYDDLTRSQQNSITAIEELLTYLEEKYDAEFNYLGYVPGELMDEEHLIAYPASGSSDDEVTVYRRYDEDGQPSYTDDYMCLAARPWYQAAVEAFFAETFQPEKFQVYTKLTGADDGVSEGTVLKAASAEIYALIDEEAYSQEQLESFVKAYGDWMKEQSGSGRSSSTSIYRVSGEFLAKTDRFNYLDNILTGEKSGRITCSVSADGEINIF